MSNQNDGVIEFAKLKVSEAQKSVAIREEMVKAWRGGTNESWKQACAMHPLTDGKQLSRKDRIKESETHARIAIKLRRELKIFSEIVLRLEELAMLKEREREALRLCSRNDLAHALRRGRLDDDAEIDTRTHT